VDYNKQNRVILLDNYAIQIDKVRTEQLKW